MSKRRRFVFWLVLKTVPLRSIKEEQRSSTFLEPYEFVGVFDRPTSNCVCTLKSAVPAWGWSFLHLDRRAHRSVGSGEAGEHRLDQPKSGWVRRSTRTFQLSSFGRDRFSTYCSLLRALSKHRLANVALSKLISRLSPTAEIF